MPTKKEHYVAERVTAGENPEVARVMSEAQYAEALPRRNSRARANS